MAAGDHLDESLEDGKAALVRRLRANATAIGVRIERIEWRPLYRVATGDLYPLAVLVAGRRKVEHFSEAEVLECARGAEDPAIVDLRLFRLLSAHPVRRD